MLVRLSYCPTVGHVKHSTSALSADRLRAVVPSAFASAPLPGVSDRYKFVPTSDVVTLFQAAGWEPVRAVEHRVRLDERRGFQAHEIRFARRDDLERPFAVTEVRPELVLRNSHDRSTAFKIDSGLFRKVCANGLVVADSMFAGIALRHVDLSQDAFLTAAHEVLGQAPRAIETVKRWQAVTLSEPARTEFATRALALRWDADEVPAGLTASALLEPRRFGDHAHDLWTTFNAVQENFVRGIPYRDDFRRRRKTRRIGSPAAEFDVNKRLWALAETFSHN